MNERLASLGRDFDTNLFSKVGVARDDELLLFYANLISNLPVTFLPPRDNFESLLFQGNIFPPLKFIAAGEFFLSLIVKRGFVLIPLFPFFSKGMRVSRTRLKGKGSSFDRCLQFSRRKEFYRGGFSFSAKDHMHSGGRKILKGFWPSC